MNNLCRFREHLVQSRTLAASIVDAHREATRSTPETWEARTRQVLKTVYALVDHADGMAKQLAWRELGHD